MKIQHFPLLPGFPHKGHWTQADQLLPHVKGLQQLTIHHNIFLKIRPQKLSHPAKSEFSANTFFRNFRTRHHISLEQNVASTNKNASVNLQCVPKGWPTFCDHWPRNGWDLLAHCDPPYEKSAFCIVAGLSIQTLLNPGQPNFARY